MFFFISTVNNKIIFYLKNKNKYYQINGIYSNNKRTQYYNNRY